MRRTIFTLASIVAVSGASITLPNKLIITDDNAPFQFVYNVKAYGAKGNGSADDTASIQEAIDACDNASGGTVYFPTGTYKVSGTNALVVANANGSHGGQHYVSLAGQSEVGSVISFAGPTNGVAIVCLANKYSEIKNLSVSNTGSKGSTIGILLTGSGGGTQSNGGYMRLVGISGFHTCIDAGSGSGFPGTSSEWIFDSLSFGNGDYGFYNHDFNGLNFMFRMLQAGNMYIAVYAATAVVFIDGGSFGGCQYGFVCRNGGCFSIRNVRAEDQTGPFVDSEQPVIIENCQAQFRPEATNNAIRLVGGSPTGGSARIINCQIQGAITATSVQKLTIEDTGVWDTQIVHITPPSGSFSFLRNYYTGGDSAIAGYFPDQVGLSSDGIVMFGTNSFSASSTNLFYNSRKVAFEP